MLMDFGALRKERIIAYTVTLYITIYMYIYMYMYNGTIGMSMYTWRPDKTSEVLIFDLE